MKVVINIEDNMFQDIRNGKGDVPRNIVRSFQATIADAIKNGIPLPKSHGKLIDASKFDVVALQGKSEEFVNGVAWVLEQIDNAPSIINEDRGE